MNAPPNLDLLIKHDIPDGRLSLEKSYSNLERLAAYCEANYMQATDKYAAFDETKRYTIQSLAGVAYHVNTLATNVLQLLDLQTDKVLEMDSHINHINQIINIHKEKVARREIGMLTSSKVVSRQPKLVPPSHQEKPGRYTRTKIDYSVLDDIGHGVRVAAPNPRFVSRTGSSVSAGSSGSCTSIPPPAISHFQVTPETSQYMATGRLTSVSKASGKEYKNTQAPTVPVSEDVYQKYLCSGMIQPNQLITQRQSVAVTQGAAIGNYSSVSIDPGFKPNSAYEMQYDAVANSVESSSPSSVFCSRPIYSSYQDSCSDGLPPPPLEFGSTDDISGLPLPQPFVRPQILPQQYSSQTHQRNSVDAPEWVPVNYLEKVVAIYDYQAEKPDELSFQENAVIYVLKKNEDGWYEGVLDGINGLFPGNYVESCM